MEFPGPKSQVLSIRLLMSVGLPVRCCGLRGAQIQGPRHTRVQVPALSTCPRPGSFLSLCFPRLQNNAYLAGLLQRLKMLFVRPLAWGMAHGRSSVSVKQTPDRFDWACRDRKDIPSGKAEQRVRGENEMPVGEGLSSRDKIP